MSIFINKRETHELMLESLALGVEMKAIYWPAVDRSGKCYETGGDQGGVAVSGYPEQRFDGDSHALKDCWRKPLLVVWLKPTTSPRRPT
jgi:hypothetical protein